MVYTDRAAFIAVLEQHGWTEESNADPENGPHEDDCYGPWMVADGNGDYVGVWYHEFTSPTEGHYMGVLWPDAPDPRVPFAAWEHEDEDDHYEAPPALTPLEQRNKQWAEENYDINAPGSPDQELA